MVEIRACKKCEGALNAFAPEGLCPKCMLLSGLDSAGDPDLIGTPNAFGDYELLQEIGRGGMGVIYKARQVSLNRVVALKMIQAQRLASTAHVQRFHMEAEAAANLSHRNIVSIHETGEHGGQHFFSMEYIEGESLAQRLTKGSIVDFKQAARYVEAVARAIHHAHQRGILHRDLKPSNVMLDRSDIPHVTDFGLAKRFEDNSTLTLTGEVLGSPSYMAPEQATSPRHRCGHLQPGRDFI
jgi:serine/threonine protein kinase